MQHHHKGVALVSVLLIVALVTIIATEITQGLQRETRRSGNVFNLTQAKQYALGAESLAITVLQQQIKDSPTKASLDQPWATQGVIYTIEGGTLSGTITDKNNCFNLNSLVEPTSTEQQKNSYVSNKESLAYILYRRLLLTLNLDESLSDALSDWLDSDTQVISFDGAEDADYEHMTQPYHAANTLMADVSELNLVRGYTPDVVKQLLPYICVLPDTNLKLNANTLSAKRPELLMMLVKNLSLTDAVSLLSERSKSGYETMEAFWQQPQLAGLEPIKSAKSVLQLNSEYFQLHASAKIGRNQSQLVTLLHQANDKMTIISRQFGITQ